MFQTIFKLVVSPHDNPHISLLWWLFFPMCVNPHEVHNTFFPRTTPLFSLFPPFHSHWNSNKILTLVWYHQYHWITLQAVHITINSQEQICICVNVTHRPATSIRGHITVDLKAGGVMSGKNRVDAIFPLTASIYITTVPWTRALKKTDRKRESIKHKNHQD